MIRKLGFIPCAILSLSASAAQLHSYEEIEASLTEGKLITIVCKYTECKMNNPNPFPIPMATAIFKPSTVLVADDGYMGAAGTWFSSKIPHASGNGINQHYTMLINNKNELNVIYSFFNADTGEKSEIQDITLNCELGRGFKVYN